MRIRTAVAEDWPHIWPFMHDIVAAGETYTLDRDLTEPDARALWMAPSPARTLVAVHGEAVVGSARFARNHAGPAAHIANASFLVDPAHAGRGIGRALGERVLVEAEAAGFTAMQFNAVVSTNTAAVRLWTSLGFEVIATLPGGYHHATAGPVGLHIMYRELWAGQAA
ncbi:hypothetical protein UO65_0409 [Actinokineospora spheciospongiae]|uniref:N-acetyltransferase domain-containing protein n=1 Tax=Actinokineospora spheciospongiae TaxID=909613 RepID=W7J5M1_9PSEU|nr:GNAT family N-acetyltransferase [Actinokineospora spheciospongiae]EWC64286.1 hypothetical protein UO65_0409 [Actinokineospora spheciospongiae]